MFDWSIYSLIVLNRIWKRDCLQMMIFVYVCLTWSIVEDVTQFETWITRNDVNGVSLFHSSYLISLMAYLCAQRAPNIQIKYYVWLVPLQTICAKHGLDTWSLQWMIFVNVCLTWRIVELKTRFETWVTRNDVNGVSLFYLSYLITHMPYLCSQRAPNIQIKIFCLIARSTEYLS
jgi:hypothetical protein